MSMNLHASVTRAPIIATAGASLLPLLLAAAPSTAAAGTPVWLPWVISAATTLSGYGLILAGRVLESFLRNRATSLRNAGNAELADKDQKNDMDGAQKIAEADGLTAAADLLGHRPTE